MKLMLLLCALSLAAHSATVVALTPEQPLPFQITQANTPAGCIFELSEAAWKELWPGTSRLFRTFAL